MANNSPGGNKTIGNSEERPKLITLFPFYPDYIHRVFRFHVDFGKKEKLAENEGSQDLSTNRILRVVQNYYR